MHPLQSALCTKHASPAGVRVPLGVCEGLGVTGGVGVGDGVGVPVGAPHEVGPYAHLDVRHSRFAGPLASPVAHVARSVQ